MAYNNRGVVYRKLNKREPAFADFNDAIRTNERNKFAWANRAIMFSEARQTKRAIDDLKRALEIDPSYQFALDALRKIGRTR